MDRLICTDRKTTGKRKLKIGKREFRYSIPGLINGLIIGLTGIITGVGAFMVFTTTFGLTYIHQDIFSGSITGGLIKIWNDIVAKLAENNGIFYDQLAGASESSGLCLTLVMIFLIIFSILIIMSRNRWLTLVYPVFSLFPVIAWNLHGSVLSYALLAFGVTLMLIDHNAHSLNWRSLIYTLVMFAIAFALLSVPGISQFANKPQALDSYTDKVHKTVADKYYGTNPLKSGNLMIKSRDKGKGVALKVTVPDSQAVYLRGFVGDTLKNKGWEPLSNTVYYQERNFTYWLDQTGFNGLGQLQQSSYYAERGGRVGVNSFYAQTVSDYSVETVNADTRYAYIPYEITTDGLKNKKGKDLNAQNFGDSFVRNRGLNRLKNYSYRSAGNLTGTWTETASKYYSNKVTDSKQTTYDIAESNYNSYVYQNYTYISPEDQSTLSMNIGSEMVDKKRGHVEYNTAVKNVKNFLKTNFTYSYKLTGYDNNLTAFENIMNTRTGYDAQYATVAVMMFRYYGIPARYVEGYIVKGDDTRTGVTTVNVSRKSNHAWAEIYVDGIGFVPVEVCPAYEGLMPETDFTVGINNTTKNPTMDNSRMASADPNDVPLMTGNSLDRRVPSKVILIIAGIIALMIIAGIIVLLILLIKKIKKALKRRKSFRKSPPRDGVRAIFEYMDYLGLKIDDEAFELGNKASYSSYHISEDERKKMLKKLKALKKIRRKERRNATFGFLKSTGLKLKSVFLTLKKKFNSKVSITKVEESEKSVTHKEVKDSNR